MREKNNVKVDNYCLTSIQFPIFYVFAYDFFIIIFKLLYKCKRNKSEKYKKRNYFVREYLFVYFCFVCEMNCFSLF